MTKINNIINFLESDYPEKKAEEWDKVGLQYGSKNQSVEKVLVALDLTTRVFEKALRNNIDLIITHHPFLWEETLEENFDKYPYKRDLHNRILNMNISVYSMHTNFDVSPKGTAQAIGKVLKLNMLKQDKDVPYAGIFEERMSINKLVNQFKNTFGISNFSTNIDNHEWEYSKFAILPGSGSIDDIIKLKNEGFDMIVTSDVKWSDWITANEEGITLIEITHGIESAFCETIKQALVSKYKSIEVLTDNMLEIVNFIP